MKQGAFLSIVVLLILPHGLLAQKAKVLGAFKHHQVYQSNKKCAELASAKEAIDLAADDIQTSQWAKTWFYRGNIYFDIALSENEQCSKLSDTALSVAYQAYRRSLELDIRKNYTTDIHTRLAVIGHYFMNHGVEYYNKQLYAKALGSFEKSLEISTIFHKTDSLSLYNAALSAEQLKDYDRARKYYEKLVETKYGGAKIYSFLANSYLAQGEREKQLEVILKGRAAYPEDQNLIIEALNYYLEFEKYQDALTVLNSAIKLDPGNFLLYFYQGTIYDNLKEYDEAITSYSRSIALKPDYFDTNFNMGVLYFNQGVELNEKAYNNGAYDEKLRKAANDKFEKSLPYLEKAYEIDSYHRGTLVSLQRIYSVLGDDEGYRRVTEELEN